MFEKYKAFIFDMDGTLVDSGQLHEVAWLKTLQKFAIPVDRTLMRSLAGVPTLETLAILTQHFDCMVDNLETISEYKHLVVNSLLEKYVKPTGLKELAEQYLGKIPMSVGTGATTKEAIKVISVCGLAKYVGPIVGADLVENPKPAPDTFLYCAELMGVAPEDCVVFEDSQLGLRAAETAGMTAIDVQTEFCIKNNYFL